MMAGSVITYSEGNKVYISNDAGETWKTIDAITMTFDVKAPPLLDKPYPYFAAPAPAVADESGQLVTVDTSNREVVVTLPVDVAGVIADLREQLAKVTRERDALRDVLTEMARMQTTPTHMRRAAYSDEWAKGYAAGVRHLKDMAQTALK